MLIPIGFFGAGAAGAYELISTAYGTGSSGTITFSSIPSTYKHLQIRIVSRTTRAIGIEDVSMQFNSDTANNYYPYHWLQGDGSTVTSNNSGGLGSRIGLIPTTDNTQTTGNFGVNIVDILDYASTSKYKTTRTFGGMMSPVNAGNGTFYRSSIRSGLWMSTSAITSIDIYPQTGTNWVAGSRFSLYGIKG